MKIAMFRKGDTVRTTHGLQLKVVAVITDIGRYPRYQLSDGLVYTEPSLVFVK